MVDANKSVFRGRLCDSCGVLLENNIWFCTKCNTCFCSNCSQDFAHYQKNSFPNCPICGVRLGFEKGFNLNNDKQKVIRYIESTKSVFQDEDDLIRKTSRLFNQDFSYARKIWFAIKEENHAELKLMEHKFKDKQTFRTLNNEVMAYKPKATIHHVPKVIEPAEKKKEETVDLKDVKPIDGLEVEWKQGKMSLVDPKKYRSTYQDGN
jgi:hypothetical protein